VHVRYALVEYPPNLLQHLYPVAKYQREIGIALPIQN
jgi:hypothetical protein